MLVATFHHLSIFLYFNDFRHANNFIEACNKKVPILFCLEKELNPMLEAGQDQV
jgi:NADPH-dependent 7-cyano-7-deazaguanine reductase QueF